MPPSTRGASRALVSTVSSAPMPRASSPKAPRKRKAKDTATEAPIPAPKRTRKDIDSSDGPPLPPSLPPLENTSPDASDAPNIFPATLTFSYEDAKEHLIRADPRFVGLFSRLGCKPFEHLERVEPFRTLTTSIIGQQIAWQAARSVNWKFMRLFDPSMEEKCPPPEEYKPPEMFPTPHQVAQADFASLRSAGLSTRKAEYIQDLAKHFSDGRLDADKIWNASDEELHEFLIKVRGIGPWTIAMFAIFSLRRPNILPVGDLGVQRGLLRWFISQHINPQGEVKLNKEKQVETKEEKLEEESQLPPLDTVEGNPLQAVPQTPKRKGTGAAIETPRKVQLEPNVVDPRAEGGASDRLPIPFTPSISRVLQPSRSEWKPPPLPSGLSIGVMKSRLDGKKKIKGALLTPEEMEALTEPWKPYRSIGVWYMWALADQDA